MLMSMCLGLDRDLCHPCCEAFTLQVAAYLLLGAQILLLMRHDEFRNQYYRNFCRSMQEAPLMQQHRLTSFWLSFLSFLHVLTNSACDIHRVQSGFAAGHIAHSYLGEHAQLSRPFQPCIPRVAAETNTALAANFITCA